MNLKNLIIMYIINIMDIINIIGNGLSLNDIDKNKLFKSNNINISYN